ARSSPAPARSGPDGPGTRFRNDAWVVLSGIRAPSRAPDSSRRPEWTRWSKVPAAAGRREPRIMEDQWLAGKLAAGGARILARPWPSDAGFALPDVKGVASDFRGCHPSPLRDGWARARRLRRRGRRRW